MTTMIPLRDRATRAARRSPAQWRSLVEAFARSGETRKQFCARHGVALSTFDWWQRRLRGEHLRTAGVIGSPALFVELSGQAAAVTPSASPWDIEIELGCGVVLRLRRTPC